MYLHFRQIKIFRNRRENNRWTFVLAIDSLCDSVEDILLLNFVCTNVFPLKMFAGSCLADFSVCLYKEEIMVDWTFYLIFIYCFFNLTLLLSIIFCGWRFINFFNISTIAKLCAIFVKYACIYLIYSDKQYMCLTMTLFQPTTQ